ncbi:hypothetical protein CAEBREN_11035 [Caenorhabditis brenneri]|uniref:Uncharacterized protein n=1 Tax=Caenorhabditis brenneri TaxID=135651 RepID=G0PF78_CAEBE|nr:hypothetical protein CAEBREN_11035 [Caenorhabditis brenneri]
MFVCRTHFARLPVGKRRAEFKIPRIETPENIDTRDRYTIQTLMGDIIEEIELRELQEERLVYMEEGYEDHEEYIPDVHVEEVPSVPKLDFNYVLVDMGILMDTLSFCQRCSSRDVQIKPQKCMGAAVSKLQQFFEALQVPHLTERAHFNIVSKRVAPAIEGAFTKMQEDVMGIVVAKGDETGEINVAGDAMYDSPGFSAIVCRYALLCVETGLVVEEPKALEIALRRLENRVAATGKDVFVGSITTDRDMSVRKMLSEKFSHMEAYYDIWHFVKNLQKTVWKNIEHFHFTTFKKCEHGRLKKTPGKYLDLTDDGDKTAYDSLYALAVTPKRIDDMQHVSPHLATSEVEAFNSVSLLYHPKSRFFSEKGFRMRMQLSVLHWNSLKLEKLEGIRQVVGKKSHFSKTHRRIVWKDVFTKGTMQWRKEIFENLQKGSSSSISVTGSCDEKDEFQPEEFEMELEEMILNEFGLEDEKEDSDGDGEDSDDESVDENEAEEMAEDRSVLRDIGDLEIDVEEQKSVMEDWSSLVVEKEKRILQFPLKTPLSVLLAPRSNLVTRAHPIFQKLYTIQKYSPDLVGKEVSSDEE